MTSRWWRLVGDRLFHVKTFNDRSLLHSEWTRKAGPATLVALAHVISMPTALIVILPCALSTASAPSAVLSIIICLSLLLISGSQLSEVSCALPRSALIYQLVYGSLGEGAAFGVGWLALLDYCVAASATVHSWLDHLNLLFRFNLSLPMPDFLLSTGLFSHFIRPVAIFGLFSAALILCCSLRVASTISVIMATVFTLTLSTCLIVGFFYANSDIWIRTGFFDTGLRDFLQGTGYVVYCYIGIEALTYLLDETHHPRKSFAKIVPCLTLILTMAFFLLTTMVTLAVDVRTIGKKTLLFDLFGQIGSRPAQYLSSVGAVCGLTGATVSLLLPPSRILTIMARDRLVSPRLTSSYMSLFCVSAFTALLLLLDRSLLIEVLSVNLTVRLVLMLISNFLQHYTDDPIGLATDTAKYATFSTVQCRLASDGSVRSLCYSESLNDDDDEKLSESSSEFVQTLLPDKSQRTVDGISETSSLLLADHYAMETGHQQQKRHDCLQSPCDSVQDHLFVQQHLLPYCRTFSVSKPSNSPPILQKRTYTKTKWLLAVFLLTCVATAMLLTARLENGKLFGLFGLMICTGLATAICFCPTNDYLLQRKHRAPGFPYLTLIALFTFILLLVSVRLLLFLKLFIWLIIGYTIYFCRIRDESDRN